MKGVRLPPFDYSQKKIIHINQENKIIKDSIHTIKSLSESDAIAKGWIVSPRDQIRDKSIFWESDPIIRLPHVGSTYEEKLHRYGIHLIEDLAAVPNDLVDLISDKTTIPVSTLKRLVTTAKQAKTGHYPFTGVTDHRLAENPWSSRYGENNWEQIMYKSTYFTGLVSVKQLVKHIDKETRAVFKDTEYEDTYFWSHDALSQMKDSACMEWMGKEGFLKKWIRPVMGVNDQVKVRDNNGTLKISKGFARRPVGNSPEIMPNDNSLFRDLRCALDLNVALTYHLENSDPRKFSKATPKSIASAIFRIWDSTAPRSERIVADIARVQEALKKIVEFEGAIVPGLADRNGWRKQQSAGKKRVYHPPKPGGIQPRSFEEMGISPDVKEVATELVNDEKRKFDKYFKSLEVMPKKVNDGNKK